MTKIIGLTGGIGSGKTTVAKMFSEQGIPVYIADEEAKKLMDLDEIIEQVKITFGNEIILNKKIDRAKLAKIVFNNAEQLKKLNKIVHPTVQKHFKKWLKIHDSAPYVIKEAAILFETNGHKQCDKVITVVAPQLLRIERVVLRDKSDKESVLQRIDNQWSDEKKILLSDYVIENIDLEKTKAQVDDIIKLLDKI